MTPDNPEQTSLSLRGRLECARSLDVALAPVSAARIRVRSSGTPAGAAGGTVCTTSARIGDVHAAAAESQQHGEGRAHNAHGDGHGRRVHRNGEERQDRVQLRRPKSTPERTARRCATPDRGVDGTIGKLVITWNTGKTSTVAAHADYARSEGDHDDRPRPVTDHTPACSSARRSTGSVTYKFVPAGGGCSTKPLATVSYKSATVASSARHQARQPVNPLSEGPVATATGPHCVSSGRRRGGGGSRAVPVDVSFIDAERRLMPLRDPLRWDRRCGVICFGGSPERQDRSDGAA